MVLRCFDSGFEMFGAQSLKQLVPVWGQLVRLQEPCFYWSWKSTGQGVLFESEVGGYRVVASS